MPDRRRSNTALWVGNYTENSVKTPDFRRKKELGLPLPNNGYYWHRYDYRSSRVPTYNGLRSELEVAGPESLADRLSSGHWYQQYGGAVSETGRTGAQLIDHVENLLNKRLYVAPVDLGVALGEYREVANLVASSIKTAVDEYRKIRKYPFRTAVRYVTGRYRRPSRFARDAAKAWLGYSYAVRPLMSDCYGSMEALLDGAGVNTDVLVHKVTAKTVENLTWSNTSSDLVNNVTVVGKAEVRGRIYFFVDNPFLYTLDQLGIADPIKTGWELIPFSFVADWFVPVGDYLGNIIPPQGIKFLSGFTYLKARTTWRRSTNIPGWPLGWVTVGNGGETIKDRRVLTGFPSFEVTRPDLTLTKSQLASAVSLLVTLSGFGGPRPK